MKSIFTYWHLDLFMAGFLIMICIFYYFLDGFRNNKRAPYFLAGYVLIILSIASPIHFLGENYLMGAHMISHITLLLIAGPLLVLGIPSDLDIPALQRFTRFLSKHPWISWMTGVCIMWFWHIPAVFNHLVENQGDSQSVYTGLLQNLHLMSLVTAGILFAWPVVGPYPGLRIAPLHAVMYLSAACIFCSVLGLMITFAPVGLYPYYSHIHDRFGFLNAIRNQHGLSAQVDQQIAGLIMWVPGCLIYLTGSMILLMRYFREKSGSVPFTINKSTHD